MTTTNQIGQIEVIGGVDTHGQTHHGAALNAATGKLLGDREFPATAKGYRQLLAWLGRFGTVAKVGIEGTGSYGAGLFRHLDSCGVMVIEVARANRQSRRLQGKSDPIDAINAARAVLAETATDRPETAGRGGRGDPADPHHPPQRRQGPQSGDRPDPRPALRCS